MLCVAAGVFQILRMPAAAQGSAPDLILTNGKIVTVDERFTIAQAVAVKGDRIVAVGTNQEIARLAGPGHAADRPAGADGRSRASSTTTCTCCAPAPPGS